MTDDDFLQRLRHDARSLRHEPDEATLERIRASIHARLAAVQAHREPTVAELLAAWFRPLAATAAAVALAALVGVSVVQTSDGSFVETSIEISVGGETYRVGN